MNPNNFTIKEKMAMRKQYGLGVSAMLAVLVLLAGVLVTPARSQVDQYYRLYPTLSLRNFHLPPHTGPKNGVEVVPGPGNGGERYFLVPVWIWNEVDTAFDTGGPDHVGLVPPGNNDGEHFGQHLEPVRSFKFQVWYHTQMEVLDTGHGSPIVMTGPSIVDGSNLAPVTAHPDTGLAKTFFVTWSDQSSNNPNNAFEHVIRIAGASEVPLPFNATSDSGYSEHNGILLWLRFRVIAPFPGDQMRMDSAMFNDHVGDSIRVQDPSLDYTHGNFGGGVFAPDYNINTGYLEVDQTAQPAFELRPLTLISQLDGALGPNDSLLPSLVYDPSVGGSVSVQLLLDDAVSLTEMNNVTISSDQSWLGVNVGTAPGSSNSVFLGWDAIDYSQSFGSTVLTFWLSVNNPDQLAPGVYYSTVTFTCDGAVNSPFKLRVRFVRLASPNEPVPSSASNTGIRLHLTNSCSPTCTSTLTFGTGAGATEGIDVLYGEDTVSQTDLLGYQGLGQCYAYFKPMNLNVDPEFQDPNFAGLTRDIRSATADSTLIYQVIFNPGNVNCYPEKVCVDPADFPAGGRIVMKFTLNGSEQGIDLRNATLDANGMECVTISDHRIDSFFIEYTPATNFTEGAYLKPFSWTLISLPVIPPNTATSVIFPNSIGQVAWSYASSSAWNQASNLEFGRGYMIRYGDYIGYEDANVAGVKSFSTGPVAISDGWNTIGGTSGPGNITGAGGTSLVFTAPNQQGAPVPSLLTTDGVTPWMWDYTPQHGYSQTVFFTPGRGYFIKVDHTGFYNLSTPVPPPGPTTHQGTPPAGKISPRETLLGELTHVYLSDAEQNGQDLYFGQATTTVSESRFEMPGNFRTFDARFDANSGMMSYNHSSYVVDLKAQSFPVTMAFSNLNGSAIVTDMNGNTLGTADNNSVVTITNPAVTQVRIAEKQDGVGANMLGYSLEANSPNPFPESTLINYSLPQQSVVSLLVYNALGQVVQTLVSGTVGAGPHQAQFDGRGLPSGTYYYTLKAGNFVQTQTMSLQH